MLKTLGRDARVVAVSVLASALVVGVPATAAVVATNSDKVDGKHAVGAKADAEKRAGRLVATNKRGQFPNDVIAKALDADLLDGKDSSAFLLADGTAVDAQLLDGRDSTEFLTTDGKAQDSDTLDGKDWTAFLAATGKASDADLLDGKNSTDFLAANGKATDADRLDGIDSTVLMRGPGGTYAGRVDIPPNLNRTTPVTHSAASGMEGLWNYHCPGDTTQAALVMYHNFSDAPTQVFVSRHGSSGTWFETVQPGGNMFIRDAAPRGGGDIFTWSFYSPNKHLLITAQVTSRRTEAGCTLLSQAVETPIQ